jgi:hypothetical protein
MPSPRHIESGRLFPGKKNTSWGLQAGIGSRSYSERVSFGNKFNSTPAVAVMIFGEDIETGADARFVRLLVVEVVDAAQPFDS